MLNDQQETWHLKYPVTNPKGHILAEVLHAIIHTLFEYVVYSHNIK